MKTVIVLTAATMMFSATIYLNVWLASVGFYEGLMQGASAAQRKKARLPKAILY